MGSFQFNKKYEKCIQIIYPKNNFNNSLNIFTRDVETLMDLKKIFSEVLNDNQVSDQAEDLANYGKDWTKHFTPNASLVLFPRNTAEVQLIIKLCNQHKIEIIPSGGRTGLSAGATATNKEVILSLEKMNKIKQFNPLDQTLECEAGAILEDIQNTAKDKGYYYPVDFAARGSCQIGGNLATNAGGIKVIRYGLTRNWVAGLTVVTGSGEILKINNGLIKNATGYDLRHLFIGSEGTLGVITEVLLKLTTTPKDLLVMTFATPTLDGIMNIYKSFRDCLTLTAFESYTDVCLNYVEAAGRVKSPLQEKAPYYLLIEFENTDGQMDKAMEVFEQCMEAGWIIDGVISQNDQQSKDLWALREDITEATSVKHPYKNDISVNISKVPIFLEQMTKIISEKHPDFEVAWFGHIGDGNLHVNILKPDHLNSDEFMKKCKEVDKEMFAMIKTLGGSVSAEHGVGLVKKNYLDHTRSGDEIKYMKQIKSIFDPNGILNPGKLLP